MFTGQDQEKEQVINYCIVRFLKIITFVGMVLVTFIAKAEDTRIQNNSIVKSNLLKKLNQQMTEEKFWKIIDSSIHNCDEDMYQEDCLKSLLEKYESEELLAFYRLYKKYHEMADTGELWAAGLLLNAGHGTDDGFIYFRNWLISCGKETYFSALNQPDSLVNADIYIDDEGYPDAEYEEFSYIAVDVYKDKTNGRDLYEDLSNTEFIEEANWDWQDYDNEEWLKNNLPLLYEKYGHLKIDSDQIFQTLLTSKQPEEVDIPGIGRVKVNGDIYHRVLGKREPNPVLHRPHC